MIAESRHWLCSTFPLSSVPLYFSTILLRRLTDRVRVIGKALNWFKLYLTGRCQRIQLDDCLSSKPDLPFGVPQGSVLGPLLYALLAAWSLNTVSLTTSALITVSCMCPWHQVTLLQHWMGYNRAWPLSSHGCWWINWNWTQIKPNASLLETSDSGANISLYFLWAFWCQS